MAKRTPFTAQQERLERRLKNVQNEIVALRGMIDPNKRTIAAQSMELGDPDSPQIIRPSEDGGLDLGSENLPWIGIITEEAGHTGDTDEAELGKIIVPANEMGPNGFVRVFASFRAKGVGDHTFKAKFGGEQFMNYFVANDELTINMPLEHVWIKGMSNSHDPTHDIDITFTGQTANPAHIVYLRGALAEAFYGN